MNTYWKTEYLVYEEFITYHEFDEDGYELKKIAFRDNQILWIDDAYYHGRDIQLINIPTPKEDLENMSDDKLIVTQLTKEGFYKLWDKITTEYPGAKY